MKKLIAALLACTLTAVLLAGCGSAPDADGSSADQEVNTEAETKGDDADTQADSGAQGSSGDLKTVKNNRFGTPERYFLEMISWVIPPLCPATILWNLRSLLLKSVTKVRLPSPFHQSKPRKHEFHF